MSDASRPGRFGKLRDLKTARADAAAPTAEGDRPARPPVSATAATKERATFHLPSDLVEEARSAAVALSGPPERLTLAALVENALRAELARLQAEHNKGKPFPRFTGKLRGGRPIGS